jgi:hypothetical protein
MIYIIIEGGCFRNALTNNPRENKKTIRVIDLDAEKCGDNFEWDEKIVFDPKAIGEIKTLKTESIEVFIGNNPNSIMKDDNFWK